jgi:NAD(P)-dependent dehydrogenase (short-subunit alcohol dehydrogenase family)
MKTALITGAARGIGLATAHRFLEDGWNVALLDRDRPELEEVIQGLPAALAVFGDVSIAADCARAVDAAVARFGALDALVNNAGVAEFLPIDETDFVRWRRVMETNLDGVFLMSQAALAELKQAKGAIVNIASISGLRASTLRLAYGTSKAAVIHMTKQQAIELGEHGIRANCVAPGPVYTKLAAAVHSTDIISAYFDAIPLNRYGKESEIAEVVHFLCSPRASYVTGQCIAVDGGFEASGVGLPALRRGK